MQTEAREAPAAELSQERHRPLASERGSTTASSDTRRVYRPVVLTVLVGLAFVGLQLLIGGVKLVYSLPVYVILGAAGLWSAMLPIRKTAGKPVAICLVGTLLLVSYVIWRCWTSPIEYLARNDLYMVIAGVVSYGILAVHVPNSKVRLWMFWILLGMTLVHVAIGVRQFAGRENYMLLPWVFRPDYSYRASGFYICPNHLAGLLEMTGLMSLSLALWGRISSQLRLTAVGFFVLALGGLAITGSRGGYLSMLGGLIAFAILSLWAVRVVQKRWFWGMVLVSIFGLSALVGSVVLVMSKSAWLQERLAQVYDPHNMRVHMWQAAIKTYELSPWTGTGAGTYLYYGRHFRDPSVQNDPQHVHSDYLELLAEYGILGCAAFGLFLVPHVLSGLGGIRGILWERLRPLRLARSNELALLIGALSGIGAISLHSVIDFNMHIPANLVVCAMLFGIIANPRSDDPDSPLRWRARGSWLRFVTVPVAGVLIVMSVPRILGEYYGERARVGVRDQLNDKAVEYAQKAIEVDPKNPRLYFYLGEGHHNLAMLQKDPAAAYQFHAKAAAAFSDGIKHFPTDIQLILKLGRTLDNMERFPEAEVIYKMALGMDPNFGNVYAYYGHHYFLRKRLVRAEKLYQRARELQEVEISPHGLEDLAKYREMASKEETADFFPIEDEPDDETWEPGDP